MQERHSRVLSIGATGMRGVVGPGLTPGVAGDFAAAFGTTTRPGTVLVGIEPRRSSAMLKSAVLAGLAGTGCEVVDGGILTAGMMHFLIPRLGFQGGILISGGHQAKGYNALLPLAADGSCFDLLRQRELFDLYHGSRFHCATAAEIKPFRQLDPQALDAYWAFLASHLDTARIAAAKLKIIADFCNGAGALYAERFAELVGVELVPVNDIPSGTIPREPEPRPRSESLLRSLVRPLGAAAGFVFDRDLSRMGVLTDVGEPLSEEVTWPLAANYFLDRYPKGSAIVTNVTSSRAIEIIAAERGFRIEKARVGQANVIDAARRTGAVAAGEGCGSFTFGGIPGFDGFLMAGILLEAIAVTGKPLSEQVAALPRLHMVKQTVPGRSPRAYQLLRQLKREFDEAAEVSEIDGLRFDWPDGFLSLRLSSTEPALRLISESINPETARDRAWRARLAWERLAN